MRRLAVMTMALAICLMPWFCYADDVTAEGTLDAPEVTENIEEEDVQEDIEADIEESEEEAVEEEVEEEEDFPEAFYEIADALHPGEDLDVEEYGLPVSMVDSLAAFLTFEVDLDEFEVADDGNIIIGIWFGVDEEEEETEESDQATPEETAETAEVSEAVPALAETVSESSTEETEEVEAIEEAPLEAVTETEVSASSSEETIQPATPDTKKNPEPNKGADSALGILAVIYAVIKKLLI